MKENTTTQDLPNTLPAIDILEEKNRTGEKQSPDDDSSLLQKPAVMSVDDTALYHTNSISAMAYCV